MQKLDIGSRGYQSAKAAATISFTPLFDRAAEITKINITNPSANDQWTVVVGGREIMRFRIDTVGMQQALGVDQRSTAPAAGAEIRPINIWDWINTYLKIPLTIPVPNGITCVVASVGGATANIVIAFRERDATDLTSNMINHYRGNEFILPVYGSLAASVTAVGPTTFDTQVAPPWLPNFFNGSEFPVQFKAKALAMFCEGQGRNTFSGAADHQSAIDQIVITKNGQSLYTRTAGANTGLPIFSAASAAGSANSVFGQNSALFPPIQSSEGVTPGLFDPPLEFRGGDTTLFQYLFAGDFTGGADYSRAVQVMLIDLVTPMTP